MDVTAQDIKNIEEESSFDNAYDREKLRGFGTATMALNGPISLNEKKICYNLFVQ